jgi:hypothetical protein
MSGKKEEILDQDNLDEVKASFGVNAEVPDSAAKKVTPPGGEGKEAKHTDAPTAVKPSKVKMMAAVAEALKAMDQDQLEEVLSALQVEGYGSKEEPKKTMKKESIKVKAEDIDVSEDVAAIFGGQDLSEEFVAKATTVFESAVLSKVNEILEDVSIDIDSEVEAQKQEVIESLSQKLDDYLEYVAEEWMKENELAVEQGIRAEIVENFMTGLRDLFKENYIDIPEEKVDLVDDLASKVQDLEKSMNEEIERNIELRKELIEMKKETTIGSLCDELTESQVVKLKSLAEGVEFESEEDYLQKLETIKETYFPSDKDLNEEVQSLDEEPIEEESDVKVDPGMRSYMQAISRSIKK